MIVLVSLHLLDLRFVVARANSESTRDPWLKPQWLWPDRGLLQVGRLGIGAPIPGRRSLLPAGYNHATVDGGLVLQTRDEFARKKILPDTPFGGFAILHREIVADENGQVRFDVLVECRATQVTLEEQLQQLLTLDLMAPLCDGGQIAALLDAPVVIAGIYEDESLKTCKGYRDPVCRMDAIQATKGSVVVASDTLNVVLIDIDGELPPNGDEPLRYGGPCAGELRAARLSATGSDVLVWHFLPDKAANAAVDMKAATWDAAGDLSWLVGQIHELRVLATRLDEYDCARTRVLPAFVREAVIRRNRRFGTTITAGWNARQVFAVAIRYLTRDVSEAEARIAEIAKFANNEADVRGVGGNVIFMFKQFIKEGDMTTYNISNNTDSIIAIGSTLTQVSQTIGTLPGINQATKDELTQQVTALKAMLEKIPVEKAEEAQAVATATQELVEKATSAKPNKTILQIAVAGVKSAAETLKDVAPPVVTIVATIASLIAKLHGIPVP